MTDAAVSVVLVARNHRRPLNVVERGRGGEGEGGGEKEGGGEGGGEGKFLKR